MSITHDRRGGRSYFGACLIVCLLDTNKKSGRREAERKGELRKERGRRRRRRRVY